MSASRNVAYDFFSSSLTLLMQADPERRIAQELLAKEVTELVHGSDGLRLALAGTEILFGTTLKEFDPEEIVAAFPKTMQVRLGKAEVVGRPISRVAVSIGAANSLCKRLKTCIFSFIQWLILLNISASASSDRQWWAVCE
jgi:hypothetical protein